MEVRRIGPDGGFVREFKDWQKRVQSIETAPAGNIVIRETLTTEDPGTGVKTIIGELPDGSYGFQPFVYDIMPPPVASTPTVSAEPGMFVITWDGTFVGGAAQPKDFECCNIIGHKIVAGATAQSVPVGMTRRPLDITYVSTDIAKPGETWQFSLEAEDYNGNRAEWSTRSAALVMIDSISSVDVAWTDLKADVAAAEQAVIKAQSAAASAQADADKVASNLSSTNQAVTAAQLKADQAFNKAEDAARDAGLAQDAADGKGAIWYLDTAPAGTGHKVGDTWFDSANNNRVMTWDGTGWITVQDSAAALLEAAKKGRTYTQGIAPPVEARLPQNLWIDTSAGVNLSVTKFWDAAAASGAGDWVPVKDKEINAAELRAAQDAKAKADAAANAAINAQAYSLNPSFDDWTGALPTFHALFGTGNPTKETTLVQRGTSAVRFNCTDTTTDRGLNWATSLLGHAPNLEYFTVELSFYLASGASLAGAGVFLDWVGMTNNRSALSLAAEVPTPVAGKWYSISKTLRRPVNATGTWTGMDGFLMANHTATSIGSRTVKDIIFDWMNIRPATAEEILSYNAPTTQYVDQAETDAINAAALTAQTKADAARDAAINDTTTKLLGKNKTVWSPDPASGTTGYIAGDTWFQRDTTGAVIAQWEFTDSWQSRIVSEAVLGGLSAGKIISGYIDSARIDAGSLSAEHIRVGDFTNLVTNGFGDLGAGKGWGKSLIFDAVDKPTAIAGVFKSTAGQGTHAPLAVLFDVTPNTEYLTEIWLKADLPNSKFFIELRDQAGTHGTTNTLIRIDDKDVVPVSQGNYPLNNLTVPTAWTKYTVRTVTTATATRLRVASVYFNHTNGTELNATVSLAIGLRRRLQGTLLVDGAIDGKVITAPTIQTHAAAASGIKLTPTEFAGYDGTAKNFSLTSDGSLYLRGEIKSGSTIEGARITGTQGIETSVDPLLGVKITNTGIKAYDAGNNLTFHLDATTGLLEVPGLKANAIKGDMIEGGTITADKLLISGGANLFTDPLIKDATGWAAQPTYFSATGGKNGGGSIIIPQTSVQSGVYYAMATNLSNRRTRLVPGSTYRLSGWVMTSADAPARTVQLYLRYQNPDSTTGTTATNVAGQEPNNRPNPNAAAGTPEALGTVVANTWTFITGMVTVPLTTTYTTGVLGVYKQAGYSTGTTTWSDLSIQEASGGELIVDGAITTNHMKTGTIDAAVLTAGTITAPKIAAKSITADKLVISSTDNLLMEADFGNKGTSWELKPNITINATAGRGAMPAMRVTGTTTTQTSVNLVNKIPVGAEDRFRGSFYVKSTAALPANAVKLMMRPYISAATPPASAHIAIVSNLAQNANAWSGTNVTTAPLQDGISPSLPVGTIAVDFYLSVSNAATATITDIDYVSVTRAFDGNLVVDGAIDGKTIKGATIIGGELKTSGVAGDVIGRMGPKSIWDNSSGTVVQRPGIGFGVEGTDASSGMYSTDGDNLFVQGGTGAQGSQNYIKMETGKIVTSASDTTTIGSRNSIHINGGIGGAALAGVYIKGQRNQVDGETFFTNNVNVNTINGKLHGIRHYTSLKSTVSPPNATVWGPGTYARDAANSFNDNFLTVTQDKLTFNEAGVYSISISIFNNSTVNTKSRAYLRNSDGTVTYFEIAKAEADIWGFMLAAPNLYLAAATTLSIAFYHAAGATMTWDSFCRVTKIS